MTFKEAKAAKKACEDSTNLIINGRRANCNLAFLGAHRPKSSSNVSPPPPQPQGTQINSSSFLATLVETTCFLYCKVNLTSLYLNHSYYISIE